MMVLHETCTLDGLIEIGVIALVDDGEAVFLGCRTELVGIEHLYALED